MHIIPVHILSFCHALKQAGWGNVLYLRNNNFCRRNFFLRVNETCIYQIRRHEQKKPPPPTTTKIHCTYGLVQAFSTLPQMIIRELLLRWRNSFPTMSFQKLHCLENVSDIPAGRQVEINILQRNDWKTLITCKIYHASGRVAERSQIFLSCPT